MRNLATPIDVPTSDCEMSRTLWSSDEAFIYEKKDGVPLEVADILRVKGKRKSSEAVSLTLKQPTTICSRHGSHTAIKEVFVAELKANDSLLQVPHMHPADTDQWFHLNSIVMSTAINAESALDKDLSQVSFQMCQQARDIQIARPRS